MNKDGRYVKSIINGSKYRSKSKLTEFNFECLFDEYNNIVNNPLICEVTDSTGRKEVNKLELVKLDKDCLSSYTQTSVIREDKLINTLTVYLSEEDYNLCFSGNRERFLFDKEYLSTTVYSITRVNVNIKMLEDNVELVN